MTKMTFGVAPRRRKLATTWKPEGAVSEPGAAPSHVRWRPRQNARVHQNCVGFSAGRAAIWLVSVSKIKDYNECMAEAVRLTA